jgi:hypothetical protein
VREAHSFQPLLLAEIIVVGVAETLHYCARV